MTAKTIWKFPVGASGGVWAPKGAHFISVQMQNGSAVAWALVDPSAERETIHLGVYGTGHDMPDNPGRFVSTIQMHGGDLVFHVFQPEAAA
jgi:hypothetical protein